MARAPARTTEIEALPEIDRIEGLPHPRETAELFGHGAAEQDLARAIAGGNAHHAWLITGPRGIGKATLAYRAAAFALAEPDERHAQCVSLAIPAAARSVRQVRALSHPGLLVVRRAYNAKDKRFPATIPVEEVRRLRGFLALSAVAGGWRVVIVDSADELNISAANALLKSLEEPPPRTLFLLVSSEPGRLLPTIRSRCRRLPLMPLADSDFEQAIRAAVAAAGTDPPPEAALSRLARLAAGSPGRALALNSGGGIELHDDVAKLLTHLPRVNWPHVHKLADALSPGAAEARFTLFFDLLLDAIAGLVRTGATAAGAAEEMQLAGRLAPPARLAPLALLWETVAREKAETVALNLDRKTLIIRTVSRLEAATR
ncbi:MAG: DNA polymerase III subunit delta' [Hyphomicrobiaceae bacterium]